jgi:hypothetical protein
VSVGFRGTGGVDVGEEDFSDDDEDEDDEDGGFRPPRDPCFTVLHEILTTGTVDAALLTPTAPFLQPLLTSPASIPASAASASQFDPNFMLRPDVLSLLAVPCLSVPADRGVERRQRRGAGERLDDVDEGDSGGGWADGDLDEEGGDGDYEEENGVAQLARLAEGLRMERIASPLVGSIFKLILVLRAADRARGSSGGGKTAAASSAVFSGLALGASPSTTANPTTYSSSSPAAAAGANSLLSEVDDVGLSLFANLRVSDDAGAADGGGSRARFQWQPPPPPPPPPAQPPPTAAPG